MSTTVQILTTNYYSQIASITFFPCSGGTISLGDQTLPYNYITIDDNYTGTYELVISAYSATCYFSIPCGSPPLVSACSPMFNKSGTTYLYYFDYPSTTTYQFYDFGHPISAITRDDNYLWIYDGTSNIYEYDIGVITPPSLLRTINTTTNSVDIYGMYPYTSPTQLVVADTTNSVYIVDISTTTASKSLLFTHGGANQPCNVLRDENIGLTYLRDNLTIKAFYDDGTQYSTTTPTGTTIGLFRDPSNAFIYALNTSGETYNIPQSSGSVTSTYVSTISPDSDITIGVAQSNSCISPLSSFKLTSIKGMTGSTLVITANTDSFQWIDFGGGSKYANAVGSMTKSQTYSTVTPYSGDVRVYSYTNFSGLTGIWPQSSVSGSPTFGTVINFGEFLLSETNKITGLEYYKAGSIFESTFVPKGRWNLLPSALKYAELVSNTAYPWLPGGTVYNSGFTYDLPSNLEVFINTSTLGYGMVDDLPTTMEKLLIRTGCNFSGDVVNLPPNLNYLWLGSNDKLSGLTSNMPPTLDYIDLQFSQNTISGLVSGLPKVNCSSPYVTCSGFYTFPTIKINGSNTISGDISGLTGSYPRDVIFGGLNTISGDILGLPNSIQLLSMAGNNTVSGCLSGLTMTGNPVTLAFLGNNIISCDGTGIPSGVTQLTIGGNNTTTGDISTYSGASLDVLNIQGSNTITGDVGGIFSGISTFYIDGNNTLFSDISTIPNGGKNYTILGDNVVDGDFTGIPSTYEYLQVEGNNVITGDIGSMPPDLIWLTIKGDNTIFGALNTLSSSKLQRITIQSSACTITGPVAGISLTMPTFQQFIYIPTDASGALTSTDVDDLLCYFTGVSWNIGVGGVRLLQLTGTNAAPTVTGLACKAVLTGSPLNVTVQTN